MTLQRWDNAGKLKAFRTPTDRRYYTYEHYKEFTGVVSSEKKIVIIIHVFSCRIYGLRKYKKKIKEDEEVEKSIQNRN